MVTGRPLFTVEQIQKRTRELAGQISRDYEGLEILSVGILKGAFMFFADIVRFIQVPMSIDFLYASSYAKSRSTGEITIHLDLKEDVHGRHVLLIEDIVDTGLTLNYIRDMMLKRDPASLKICSLLNKQSRRQVDVPIDYIGYDIPDSYVVGYGLDYDNKFRNLPYISVFKEST